eukprot:CAMPEP_0113284210 /NCGR_PEP_ID=MMETSP0008_2-20120614/29887_1 /TAXON_ID=97485 /ORGANISM="Prymnesium parvum" /LENGTH=46 /DNA_ID=CAMNT_0000135027 /DNA_START=54 /DNA_END=191 /DNA_ORIENTATION=- /assembly_acc=CAM_ASM_000153
MSFMPGRLASYGCQRTTGVGTSQGANSHRTAGDFKSRRQQLEQLVE